MILTATIYGALIGLSVTPILALLALFQRVADGEDFKALVRNVNWRGFPTATAIFTGIGAYAGLLVGVGFWVFGS